MAVEALTVVIGRVQTDTFGRRWIAEILHPDVMQATPFCSNAPIEGVIRVACIARLVAGNPVVLKVSCGNVARIIHIQTLPERLHDVTREAERSLLGMFHVVRETYDAAQ
jgi:hypothetical protein